MASKPIKIPYQTTISKQFDNSFKQVTPALSFSFPMQHTHQLNSHLLISYPNQILLHKARISHFSSTKCSISSPNPPTSREEAILQAKTSLSSTLEKPLNNPKLPGKLKKLKQPRFRVEVPIIDESASSLSELALEIFGNMPIRRKGSKTKILILWASESLAQAASNAFESHSSNIVIQNADLSSVLDEGIRASGSADVAVFFAPEDSQLDLIKEFTDGSYPRPVVIFNPKWIFEDETNFADMSGFVGSFDVVYSFTGLEVRGLLSKRKGVIFKCVRDGVLSSEQWNVLVEEESGELRVVSRFKTRPSITEVENVLYNVMAINSPVTKSAKFLKDLVSSVTGKK